MLKFYGSAGYKKNLWVRGLADISIVRDTFGNDKLPPFVANSINILLSNAQSAGLQIRFFQPPGAMGFTKYPILGVQTHSDNNTWSDLLLDPNNPLLAAPPAQLRFFQIPHDDLPGFARQYNVVAATAVAPFALTVPYRYRGSGVYATRQMALMALGYGYDTVAGAEFIRFSDHKTGRPFGSLAGRTRALVRSQ